jgi:hypothetical protein
MSYDFVNNLEINEAPLTLAQLEGAGAVTSTEEAPAETKSAEPVSPEAVVPVDMTTIDSEESKVASTGSSKTNSSTGNIYEAFVKEFLLENGIDPEEVELPEITSAKEAKEVIAELYTSERDNQIEEYKNNFLTPLQKRFADLVEKGVSPEEAGALMISYKSIEGITEESIYEDKAQATALLKEYLKKTTKFSDAKIEKEISLKDELGTLEDDAKEALPELKTLLKQEEAALLEEKKYQETERIRQAQAQAEALKEYLENTENIGGFQLNKSLKDKWKKEYSLLEVDTPEGKTRLQPIQATRLQNPQEFDALMRLYHTLGLFKFDARKKTFSPDFSALKSLGAKETISEFENIINSQTSKAKFKGGATITPSEESKEAELNKWKEFYNKLNK